MAKPEKHAASSARKYGGDATDYVAIHNMMDSSKAHVASNIHRCMFHHSFGIFVMERMFGTDFTALDQLCRKHNLSDEVKADILAWKQRCIDNGTAILNSQGRQVSVRDVAEQHILEDFGMKFIPTLQDYIEGVPVQMWMNNGIDMPPSVKGIEGGTKILD